MVRLLVRYFAVKLSVKFNRKHSGSVGKVLSDADNVYKFIMSKSKK